MNRAIWWIRRDLRLADNQALHAALDHADHVLPVFILDPRLLNSDYCGDKRVTFLFDGLRRMDADLRQIGSSLKIRKGYPPDILARLADESGATAVFAEEDFSPYARRRDEQVAKAVPLHLYGGLTVHHPDMVLKQDGEPYTVFTPFSKSWRSLPLPVDADLLPSPTSLGREIELPSLPLPAASDELALFSAGEEEGLRRLRHFTTGANPVVYLYGKRRNQPHVEGTSGLSPYLRFGMVSMRQVVVKALAAVKQAEDEGGRESANTWLNELIWREFFLSILYHYPRVRQRSFRPQYEQIEWRDDKQAFEAWCRGRTGYPMVDAAMRQLSESGWMHNRCRMVTASFLVKDLLINWRWGERWFMQQLVDGDPAANNGGWQWTAGTGTDAAPYFRIFNPVLQSKKFDPNGEYIRRWLPELTSVPESYIHEPWKMPADIQRQSNCVIDVDYPAPMVDHRAARERTMAAYQLSTRGD